MASLENVTVDISQLNKLHRKIKDPKKRKEISIAMAWPVLQMAKAEAGVGDKINPRYRSRKKKGKKNKRARIWSRTLPGNLRSSHIIDDNIGSKHVSFVRVGPRVHHKQGRPFAFYAWAHHKLQKPWLRMAQQKSAKQSIQIGMDLVMRAIKEESK